MSYFELDPKFLKDEQNIKLKDVAFFNQSYDSIDREGEINILVPIPWDGSTAGRPGARFAPKLLIEKLLSFNLNIYYRKSICIMPYVKIIIGDKFQTFNNISKATEKVLDLSQNCLFFIGGDHSITQPILEQYVKKYQKINLVVFDSHFDLRIIREGLSGGTYLYELKEKYHDDINVVIFGIKHSANPDYLYQLAQKYNVKFLTNLDVLFRNSNIEDFLKSHLDRSIPTYISVDVDSIDNNIIDSVNSPSSLGLTLLDILYIFGIIRSEYWVVGVDIVEFNPLVGNVEKSLLNLAELVYHISR